MRLPIALLCLLIVPTRSPAAGESAYLDASDPAMREHYTAYRKGSGGCWVTGSALARRRSEAIQRLRSVDPERLGRFLIRSYQNAIAAGDPSAGSILVDLALLGPEIALPFLEQELLTGEARPSFHRRVLLEALREVRSPRALPLIQEIYAESVLGLGAESAGGPPEHALRLLALGAAVANSFGTLSHETLYDPVRRSQRMGDLVWVARPPDATDEHRARVIEWLREVARHDPRLEVRSAATDRLAQLEAHGAARALP